MQSLTSSHVCTGMTSSTVATTTTGKPEVQTTTPTAAGAPGSYQDTSDGNVEDRHVEAFCVLHLKVAVSMKMMCSSLSNRRLGIVENHEGYAKQSSALDAWHLEVV